MKNAQVLDVESGLLPLPKFYYEDDFPLDDCIITLVKKGGQWLLKIYAPGKYDHKGPLESYRPYSLAECFYQLEVGRRAYAAKTQAFKLENRTTASVKLENSQKAGAHLAKFQKSGLLSVSLKRLFRHRQSDPLAD